MSTLSHSEWVQRYSKLKGIADRVHAMIRDRAVKACKQAGLCPDLLGIHPHNAMVSYESGKPWAEVDYQYCRLTLHLLDKQFEPYHIVSKWDKRVRGY